MGIVVAINARDTAIDRTNSVAGIVVRTPVAEVTRQRALAARIVRETPGRIRLVVRWLVFMTFAR